MSNGPDSSHRLAQSLSKFADAKRGAAISAPEVLEPWLATLTRGVQDVLMAEVSLYFPGFEPRGASRLCTSARRPRRPVASSKRTLCPQRLCPGRGIRAVRGTSSIAWRTGFSGPVRR